jgi:hypothetical protein
MGYYMRYIVTDRRGLDLQLIEDALKGSDPAYSIANRQSNRIAGDLAHGNDVFAQIEINQPRDGLFDDEIEELLEFAQDGEGKGKREVISCLKKARSILAIQVLFRDDETEVALEKIDPLWHWLFKNRKGLLQADGEGYYMGPNLILRTE